MTTSANAAAAITRATKNKRKSLNPPFRLERGIFWRGGLPQDSASFWLLLHILFGIVIFLRMMMTQAREVIYVENKPMQGTQDFRIIGGKHTDSGKDGSRRPSLSFPPGDLDDMIFCDNNFGGYAVRHSER